MSEFLQDYGFFIGIGVRMLLCHLVHFGGMAAGKMTTNGDHLAVTDTERGVVGIGTVLKKLVEVGEVTAARRLCLQAMQCGIAPNRGIHSGA